MAKSMRDSVLGKASDFYDENANNCQPCSVQGKGDIPAKTFCVDCQEYLCENCSTYHKVIKALQNHVLVTTEEAKKKAPPKVTKDKSSLKCTVHKGKTVKYFCVSHAYLACSICITMDHKQCTDVDYIPTVAEDIRNHDGFKKFDKRLKAMESAFKAGLSDVEKTMKTIAADERQMKDAIQQFRKQLNDALDTYEKEITVKVGAISREETKKLNVLSKEFATSFANVATLVEKVDNLLSSGKHCDTYVLMKKEAEQLVSLEKKLTKAVHGASYQRYGFQPNKDVLADTLGTLSIKSENVSFNAAKIASAPFLMVKFLKNGTRVRRGMDWDRGDSDGFGLGKIVANPNLEPGWYQVKWDYGKIHNYRMGAENAYDLEIV